MYDSGKVSLEHLLLSWYSSKAVEPTKPESMIALIQLCMPLFTPEMFVRGHFEEVVLFLDAAGTFVMRAVHWGPASERGRTNLKEIWP